MCCGVLRLLMGGRRGRGQIFPILAGIQVPCECVWWCRGNLNVRTNCRCNASLVNARPGQQAAVYPCGQHLRPDWPQQQEKQRVPTWLVTGGAGFIGGNFVLETVARGIRVINLDALTYAGNPQTLASLQDNPAHVFVHGDIGDRALVARLLAEHQPDAVLNFAAESHVDRSIDGPGAFIQTNVVGTLGLLEAVRDYWKTLPADRAAAFRFLHVSTDEVFGTLSDTGYFTETTPYPPNSLYSASNAQWHHLVRAFHHTYGLPVLTTN